MVRQYFFLLLFLFCSTSALFSLEMAATLEKSTGTVTAFSLKHFKKRAITAGDEIPAGTWVKTASGSTAHLRLSDGTRVLVKENSTFKLRQKKKRVQVDFDRGEFLIGVPSLIGKKERSFEVKTPSAVVGVRGTLFWGLVDDALTSTFACFESRLVISANGVSRNLEPGDKVVIPFGQDPGPVEAANVPLKYMDTFAVDGGVQDLKDLAVKGAGDRKRSESRRQRKKKSLTE